MSEQSSFPHILRVRSSTPVSDLEAFDMMSRFLAAEKARKLSQDFSGQTYLASSSQIWNDLRLACNSILQAKDPRRDHVAPWKDLTTVFTSTTTELSPDRSKSQETEAEAAKRSTKKMKKEAKKAKKAAKKAKKQAKKEAKKRKKESKKRKREEV